MACRWPSRAHAGAGAARVPLRVCAREELLSSGYAWRLRRDGAASALSCLPRSLPFPLVSVCGSVMCDEMCVCVLITYCFARCLSRWTRENSMLRWHPSLSVSLFPGKKKKKRARIERRRGRSSLYFATYCHCASSSLSLSQTLVKRKSSDANSPPQPSLPLTLASA